MNIYFLRHGDALVGQSQDSERPLSDLGKHQAESVGRYLRQRQMIPDVIFTSPLRRAQETAKLVQTSISSAIIENTDYLVNGMDEQRLCNLLCNRKASSVLLIGHIPHLEDVISLLVEKNVNYHIEMKKCSLAHVEIEPPLQPGTGTLKFIKHFKELELK